MTATLLALCLLAYLSGEITWSVWLGRAFYGVDVRAVADGNPGATNAYRAGGWKLGAAVVLLDFFKAFVTVLIARWGVRLPGEQVILVALLPTVGHAFSIFLRFRGGRALAIMFGAWSGLTLYEVPLVMGGAAIVSTFALKNDAQRALAVRAAALEYVLVRGRPAWMVALAVAQIAVLAVKLVVHARAPRRPLPET